MSQEDDPAPSDSRTVRAARQIDKALEKTAGTAKRIVNDTSKAGAGLIRGGRATALKKFAQLQSRPGEDYCEIFANNPLVLESLARSPLLIDEKELLSTALNVA